MPGHYESEAKRLGVDSRYRIEHETRRYWNSNINQWGEWRESYWWIRHSDGKEGDAYGLEGAYWDMLEDSGMAYVVASENESH